MKSASNIWNNCCYNGSYFGTGVDVVSKKALDINFARNDIILYNCEIFRQIKKDIEDYVQNNKLKKSKLTKDEKKYFFNQFLTRGLEYHLIRNVKLFTDVFEKDFSLEDFVKANRVAFSDGKSGKLAELVHENKAALVFNKDYSYLFGDNNFDAFIKNIWDVYDFLTDEYEIEHPAYYLLKKDNELLEGQEIIDDIKNFESIYSVKHEILEHSQLSRKDSILLKAIRRLNDIFYNDYKRVINCKKRKIVFGNSLASDAWTDGVSYIALNFKFIELSEYGTKFFDYILKLIIHEYCHNEFTISVHPHNEEFYKLYHDITIKGGFKELKDNLVLNISNLPKRAAIVYHNELERNDIKAPKKLKEELSNIQESIENDNVESILRSFGRSYYNNNEANSFEDNIQELFLNSYGDDNIPYRYILTKNKILESLIKSESFNTVNLFNKIDNIWNFIDFIIATLSTVYYTHTINGIKKNIDALIDAYNSRSRDYNIEQHIRIEINEPLDYRNALKFIYRKNKKSLVFRDRYAFDFCIVEKETYNRLEKEFSLSNKNLFEKLILNDEFNETLEVLKNHSIEISLLEEKDDYKSSNEIRKNIYETIEKKSYIITNEDYHLFEKLGYNRYLDKLNLLNIYDYLEYYN